jgi:hypothetical protein
MKKVLLSFSLFLGALSASRAAVLTLNNYTPSPGQYTTFAAAQTAAAAGDTILVQASPTSYGAITISKRLVIIGPGHKPNKFPSTTAEFSSISISANLTGIKIYGIKFSSCSPGTNVDDLIFENVYCTSVIYFLNDCNGLRIRNSVFDGGFISLQSTNADDALISHNYFSSSGPLNGFEGVGQKTITNNLFAWNGSGNLTNNMRNALLTDNIFYGLTANTGTQTDCVYNNNLSFGHTTNNTLPPVGQGGANNLVDVDPKFENAQAPTASAAFQYTRNYRLKSDSPAIAAGSGGRSIGLYNSQFEFSMTGEPFRPQTILLNLDPIIIPPGGTTTVNFTGRKATVNAQ